MKRPDSRASGFIDMVSRERVSSCLRQNGRGDSEKGGGRRGGGAEGERNKKTSRRGTKAKSRSGEIAHPKRINRIKLRACPALEKERNVVLLRKGGGVSLEN